MKRGDRHHKISKNKNKYKYTKLYIYSFVISLTHKQFVLLLICYKLNRKGVFIILSIPVKVSV